MLTHLSLFSGIGGIDLAAEWAGFETVCFVEIDKFCQKVLRKHWPDVPLIEDVHDVTKEKIMAYASRQQAYQQCEFRKDRGFSGQQGESLEKRSQAIRQKNRATCDNNSTRLDSGQGRGTYQSLNPITLITGGFPCQPVSVVGKRRGKEDDRWLWPEMLRVISEVRPTWVVAENVAGLVRMGLNDCLSDLEGEGFEVTTFLIPACAVNAPHRRDRIFIVAHIDKQPTTWTDNGDFGGKRQEQLRGDCGEERGADWWAVESDVGRVAHGVPHRVDRLRALGNAVVPQQIYPILRVIAEVEYRKDIAELDKG